ncbi:TPA: hypothetical protein ACGAAP_000189 [Escherichia coli]|uniref:Uncharacterized protein n=1 Tax=Salmonella enterica TaxID=28901 RepID=A0A5V4LFW6_SALER|nr:hypothetical protein [Escherichia coli]EAU0153013.1 hypothetical protein [Salmonella enterica]ECC8336371.1 hypothetical protein [Salmonella enterica subsp. enterica serovar Ruiru]EBH3756486.1 hypothetical protein [Salmonella enterica]EBH4082542.1 hypothetical protein [Salmonella enterica]EBU2437206.1 hypothetical protein [Salmonella enterica]
MSNQKILSELLVKFPFIKVKDVTDFMDTILLIIPINKIVPLSASNSITKRQISLLVKRITEKLNVRVLISYSPFSDKDNIEAALVALARSNFKKGKISDLNLSFFDSQNAVLYVFCKNLTLSEREKWESLVVGILNGFNIKVTSFVYEAKNNPEPTMMVILRAAKKCQPFDLPRLFSQLDNGDYHIESLDWLNGKLDNLRKKGFLLRSHDGTYRMTLSGLEIVPVTKSRQSSDIERVLYLARKHL